MNNDWPSSYWLACRFQTRGVEAMVKPHTCVPVPVVRSSGSAVRLPTIVRMVSPGH